MCSAVAQVADLRLLTHLGNNFAMLKFRFICDPSPEQSVTDGDTTFLLSQGFMNFFQMSKMWTDFGIEANKRWPRTLDH